MKACDTCHQTLPYSAFARYSHSYHRSCRACVEARPQKRREQVMRSLADRFWSKVDRSGGQDACWEWKASRRGLGYGQFAYPGRSPQKAHRVAYELESGPIPDGLGVLHKCDNPPCCNPRHLFLGTNADNMADMVLKGRQRSPGYRGEGHHQARLCEADVLAIRERAAQGETGKTIGPDYGICPEHANRIIRRESWKHL